MVKTREIELILEHGVGRSGLPNENEVIASALRELYWYKEIGTVEGFKIAIQSSLEYYNRMKEYQQKAESVKKITPRFSHNLSDITSYWVCECGNGFKTTHEPGILKGTDVMFCSKCGVGYNWSSEEE